MQNIFHSFSNIIVLFDVPYTIDIVSVMQHTYYYVHLESPQTSHYIHFYPSSRNKTTFMLCFLSNKHLHYSLIFLKQSIIIEGLNTLSLLFLVTYQCYIIDVDASRSWCSTQLPNGWMRDLNQYRFLTQSLYLQKTSGQGVRTHPPMVLSAMVGER